MTKPNSITNSVRIAEGEMIRELIRKKKESDNRYTQAYVASLLDREQTIFPQWLSGKTPIPDVTFVALSEILDFNPLETRPYLRQLQRQLSKFAEDSPVVNSSIARDIKPSLAVPVLSSEEAIEFLESKILPKNCQRMEEITASTAHLAFGLREESQQFEPAIQAGAIYYVIPTKVLRLNVIGGSLIACLVNQHLVVGRAKTMALGKIHLQMPDNTEIELVDGLKQVVGIVSYIKTP